jgi:hypothetical protein
MIDKNVMTSKLKKRLYNWFLKNTIIGFLTVVLVFIFIIIAYNQFREGTEKLRIVIICVGILIVILTVAIIGMNPILKDMRFMKICDVKSITGTVIKYRKVVHGGDPTTYSYYPIIRDINANWIEVEVKADDTELNQTYHCVYLPNTKLAVCELADIESNNIFKKT